MNLVKFAGNFPAAGAVMEPGTPLWQIVPTRGADGRSLADFMMLIPKLNKRPQHIIDHTLNNLLQALEPCPDVVFVNFNMKLNVLWVSVNCRHRLILELVTEIQNRVPEAKLVA
jgi:hypothetical protein